jgi:hypothetical protein
MPVRLLIASIAALALSSGAAAEPSPGQAPAAPEHPVRLASADKADVPAVASQRPAAQPAKPGRAMRVTTCRCGDPQVKTDTQLQR